MRPQTRTRSPGAPAPNRGFRTWRAPLIALAVVAPIGGYFLFMRDAGEAQEPPREAVAEPVRAPNAYRNRSHWVAPTAPAGQSRAARITGTAYDLNGNPVAGVELAAMTFEVSGNRASPARRVESDASGRFELLVADGSYYVAAHKAGYTPAQVVAHSGDEVGIILRQGGEIAGRVTDEKGNAVQRFSIDLIGATADDMPAQAALASKSFDSPDGSFRLEEVPGSQVHVRAVAEGFAPSFSPLVAVPAGESKSVDLVLSAGCTLKGVVRDRSGQPLSDVLVDAERRQLGGAGLLGDSSIDATSQGETGADGLFELANVPAGDVMIRAYDGMHAVSTLAIKVGRCEDLAPVELKMGAGGGLSGVVRDLEGKPIGGAKVVLSHRAIGFVNTMSNEEGEYHFDRLPAADLMRLQALRGEKRVAALVTVEEGKTTERDLLFPTAGTGEIHGRVTAGGRPLAGMQLLVVTNSDDLLGMYYPVTGIDGTYRVSGVPDGMYVLLVSSTERSIATTVTDGSTQTVDIDVAAPPEPLPPPEIPPAGLDAAPADEPAGEP